MLIFFVVGTLAVCAVIVWLNRRHTARIINAADAVLDGILARDFSGAAFSSEESRVSKLAHKANRITAMLSAEADAAKAERDTVQGFISDMSHQMKTPLSGIAMYTELLLEGSLSSDNASEFLSRIMLSANKLQWMTDSLIKLSRLETGAIAPSPANESIRQTISEAVSVVLGEADKKNIAISVEDFADHAVFHDRKWTAEALVNVLDNAIKYSPQDSEIIVRVDALQQHTKITIQDSGIGIPKHDWNNIFRRFYRGQNVKDREGVGLGLYLVRVILESQGGYVLVKNVDGGGAGFDLFLRNCV